MFEKILQQLKTKYKDFGLSETILKAKAKQIEKAVKAEDEIENAVAGVEDDLAIFQSFADQNRTLAKKIEELEKGKTPDKPEDKPEDKPTDKPTGEAEPAWVKALNDKIDKQNELISGIQAEKAQQTNAEKFQSKLKELEVSDDYLKTLPTFERSFQSDEEIDAIAKEYKEKSDVFAQMSANSALGNMAKPSLFGTEVKEGAVSPEVQALIDSKKSQN
ncbi:hypothetical protein HHL23_09510 [Chryseobacterium sp. RP-3-3]|uniref:Phage minor structural protein GP20 n=1 Tax=Chryseobacterium antibioticum TaxID=2728847 RepID=A0A7Y0AMN1_9FLAO|nr:hypothetical protein [Chryseobacterium antibioticum]NML70037.1 hypothetical protein [Chryseobacterium antibioticum]